MVNRIKDLLIQFGAIEFGDFTLASGAKSPYYIDVKTAATHPELLGAIVRKIARTCRFDMIAGVAVGGIPLAVATSVVSNKPYAIIRAAEKSHGKKDIIIGNVQDKTVLLVEDVTTSGGSALFGVQMLRQAGARIDCVVTVVDRDQGAAELLSRHGIRLVPLVRMNELL